MIAAAATVFLIACLHEDVALLAAAWFVVEQGVPAPLAAASAFGGMLVNNLTLYLLGAQARRHAWVRRRLAGARALRIRHRLERHLVTTLALARLGQGLLTPALLGCGCLHVPLRRVAPVVAGTAAVYLAVLLTLAIVLGERLVREAGGWAWLVPVALLAIAGLVIARRRIAGA
jgi:membrane protein DedA with SNARE-associated domain